MSATDGLLGKESSASPRVREVQLKALPPSEEGDENDDLEFGTDEDGEGNSHSTKKRKCTSKEGDENDDLEFKTDEDGKGNSHSTKKRKCTSKGWGDFKDVTLQNGIAQVECNNCSSRLSLNNSDSITARIERHHNKCFKKNVLREKEKGGQRNNSLAVAMSQSISNASDPKYDHAEIGEKLAHLIIMHELPFHFAESKLFNSLMESVTPHYERISLAGAKKYCLAAFKLEEEEVMADLDNVNRVSVSTDLWKSGKDILYMVVSCQYVDFDLNPQKRILNFCEVPPPHSGLVLCDVLHKCLAAWKIEKKVWTVTVGNGVYNDVAVRILRDNLSYNQNLPLGGKFFRVRCYAQMLNLVVQDALSAIKDVIFKVSESVKYVVASESRINMFSEIAKQLELSSKKLVLDCCTRWNATYSMLSAALDFKDVFSKYQQWDTSYALLPSEEEWKKVLVVCSFLQAFNLANHLQPGTKYLSSNLFLWEFVFLKRILSRLNVGEDTCMRDMVTKMKGRLDNYWRDCYLLMCVAAVLDPRRKMKLIDFCLKNVCSSAEAVDHRNKVLETLQLLFNEYVEADKTKKAKTAKSPSNASGLGRRSSIKYLKYLNNKPGNSELDVYLDQGTFPNDDEFDVLSWWRQNSSWSPILSKMAYDVLSIPLTTVTSEAAFDAGSRVIDPRYASLGVDTVQFLLCGGDWLRTRYYGYKTTSQEKVGIQEFDLP